MSTNEQEEWLTYLSELVKKTKNGAIKWNKLNPTTYMWARPFEGTTVRVFIQKVEKKELIPQKDKPPLSKSDINYIFQIMAPSSAERTSLNSAQNPFYSQVLSELFTAIEENVSRMALNLFKKMLKE
jgi:hypothetical protein